MIPSYRERPRNEGCVLVSECVLRIPRDVAFPRVGTVHARAI